MLPRTVQIIDLVGDTKKPLRGAEIGVYKAEMSADLLKHCPGLLLLLVDSWKPYDGGDWTGSQSQQFFDGIKQCAFENILPYRDRCFILEQPSPAASLLFQDNLFDFVFIDGNHTEDAVWQDVNAWYEKVKEGGILSGHDYVRSDGKDGVERAVRRFSEEIHVSYETGMDATWWIRKP